MDQTQTGALHLRYDRGQTKPRPRRGDPIAKVGNPSGEEEPLEPVDPEPDGGGRTVRKHRKTPVPTARVRTTTDKAT